MAFTIQSLIKAVRGEGRRAAYGLYGGLCAATLHPLMLAVQGGNPEQISAAAIALAGAAGVGLLTNLAQKAVDASNVSNRGDDDERNAALAKLIEDAAASDARTADALDAMLKQRNAIEQARAELSGDDKAWFTETLRAELRDLGSSLTINAQGAVVLGNVQVLHGDFVARDKIINNFYSVDHVDWARHYLRQLMFYCNRLPLGEMNDREGAEGARDAMTLDQVYVTLNVRDPQAGRDDGRETEFIAQDPRGRNRGLPARSAIARSELAVLHSAPGSGKSAFVRQLAADLCAAQLGEANLPAVMRPLHDLCPVLVNLRDLAEKLKDLPSDPSKLSKRDRELALADALWQAWEGELATLRVRQSKVTLEQKLLDGKALLIFDGLDEVTPGLRELARDTALAAANAYAKSPRVIVTVRTRSYDAALLRDFDAYELLPFDEAQIQTFTHRWYAVQKKFTADEAKTNGDALASAARDLPDDLVSNPLLLTVTALVHQQDQAKLPRELVKLLDRAIDVMLRRWRQSMVRVPSEDLKRMLDDDFRVLGALRHVAFIAHQRQADEERSKGRDRERSDQAADLRGDEIVALLKTSEYFRTEPLAQEFLDYVDAAAGILVGQGGRDPRQQTYSFPHRSFQEYLAGRFMMLSEGEDSRLDTFLDKAAQGDYWERAALLGAEAQYHGAEYRNTLRDLIYQLCPEGECANETDWRAALWSASFAALDPRWIAEDARPAARKLSGGEDYLKRARQRLLTIMCERRLPAIERAASGRALARLGDPREEVLTVEKMVLVEIPAGEFLAGDEKEKRMIEHPFWISQYPITNAQFDQFVRDEGYTKLEYAEWWREAAELGWWEAGKGYKGRWDDDFRAGPERYKELFDLPNHPVVGVSWHEALAFTRWLNARWHTLRVSETLRVSVTNTQVRLPTEWEWERAARGEDGRVYPWGDKPDPDMANYNDTRIGATSAVGCFPRQDHWPNACEDMSGNVWEWTLSKYTLENEADAVDTRGDARRMLRGGSWAFLR